MNVILIKKRLNHSLNYPYLIIFPVKIVLNYSCSIWGFLFVNIKDLTTEGMNEILVSAQIIQPKFLSDCDWSWLLKYRGTVLITVRSDSQILTWLMRNDIHIRSLFDDIKTLVGLAEVFVYHKDSESLFVLTNVEVFVGSFRFYDDVSFEKIWVWRSFLVTLII